MGIKANFSMGSLELLFQEIPEIASHEMTRAFSYLGEQCVTRIRDRSGDESWNDQTGNLRSSIGYAVYDHGRTVIESAFNQVGSGTQGSESGRAMVDALARRWADTYALAVVAGMDYASYVEAKDNKDVLASAELWAKSEIGKTMEMAIARIEKRLSDKMKAIGFK